MEFFEPNLEGGFEDLEFEDEEVLQRVRLYGDSSSSLISAGSEFEEEHFVRYVETPRSRVGANEPLCEKEKRADALQLFARSSLKRTIAFPVSEGLSKELTKRGFYSTQIGLEPVYDLKSIFGTALDPLVSMNRARKLLGKGVQVYLRRHDELSLQERKKINELHSQWLAKRKTSELGFLSRSRPFEFGEEKFYFVLKNGGRIDGFLAALPIYPRSSFYASEFVTSAGAPRGSMDLLIVESMREMFRLGAQEFRMGICFLAGKESRMGWLGLLSRVIQWGYDFDGLYRFKSRFRPIRWEKRFLVSNRRLVLQTFLEAARVHFSQPLRVEFAQLIRNQVHSNLLPRMQSSFRAHLPLKRLPRSLGALLWRMKSTLSLVSFFAFTHFARLHEPQVAEIFRLSAFQPARWTLEGLLLGPLFHNNLGHLLGDLSTFVVFVGAMEVLLGAPFALGLVGMGLWMSNPFTVGVVAPFLEYVLPSEVGALNAIRDYGTSNAVYAAAGGLAALLSKPQWVWLPFAGNAIAFCVMAHNWLAVHHLVALLFGFLITRWRTR